ncbi:MAG: glycosyltransferase [Chloroflexi bacterium]|nr:glycosyltransferase [Chloroflexota bacterium]
MNLPREAAPPVAVVVVNWNGRRYLESCLAALSRQTYPNLQVVLVDNGSTDGSAELVESQFPGVRLIRNDRNLGFAAANNQAIRATDTPYVATLNNDTLPEPGWLAALVSTAESDPSLGAVASKMVFAGGLDTINSCGIALDRAGIAWDLFGGWPAAAVDRPREVFGACAGAALYRRAMLDDVGLFEASFFAYLEDVDLAWRARLRGWKARLAPQAVVAHVHSGTLGDASSQKRFFLARNKIWTIVRCLPGQDLSALPFVFAYDLGAVCVRLLEGDLPALFGRVAAIVGLPKVLLARRRIQQRVSLTSGDLIRSAYAPIELPWRIPARYRHLQKEGRRLVSPRSSAVGPDLADPPFRDRLRWLLLGLAGRLAAVRRAPRAASGSHPGLRIAVLRPDHLGDVLLSRPAIQLLQRELMPTEVTVITGPWGAASLQGIDCRVATFPYPGFQRAPRQSLLAPYGDLLALVARLRRERFDAALILRPDHWWGALACALAGIEVRVGHTTPGTSPLLTHTVPLDPHQQAAQRAIAAAGALVGALGMPQTVKAGPVTFEPTPEAVQFARQWLSDHAPVGRHRVVIHPGSGVALKLWPSWRWAEIIDALAKEEVVSILTGGPEDTRIVAVIGEGATAPASAAVGFSWDQLAGLYQEVDLVMGVDSGPLHLATAVGTPTVRLYGPTDPAIFGPSSDSSEHVVIQSRVKCAPCGNLVAPPCGYRGSAPCMATIEMAELLAAARGLMAERAAP